MSVYRSMVAFTVLLRYVARHVELRAKKVTLLIIDPQVRPKAVENPAHRQTESCSSKLFLQSFGLSFNCSIDDELLISVVGVVRLIFIVKAYSMPP